MDTPPSMSPEKKELKALQKKHEKMAMQIAKDAVGYMMALGWIFDGGIQEVKDENGKVVSQKPVLVVRPLTLAEWQNVKKEKLRKSLTLPS